MGLEKRNFHQIWLSLPRLWRGDTKEGWAVLIPHWLRFLFSPHPQSRGTNDSSTHPADPQENPFQKNTLGDEEKKHQDKPPGLEKQLRPLKSIPQAGISKLWTAGPSLALQRMWKKRGSTSSWKHQKFLNFWGIFPPGVHTHPPHSHPTC